ncbi:nitrite reductase small subunit NirD [Dyella mobilis]|uniref:Nitrite reductase small subunit NirD n=1 Tax=Dyella mobilis TaxID=1849582 RepID=A0ABS2KCF6_9GAMM|nr:nitrite reductase small subunit NirD [Dyella mobilis]MBM7128865.1 nitrite reductase small subunit NirD [Dyella mobilis]GLQ99196.1 nitrite reductase small subunit [Dyella mobilis]
MDDIVTTSGMLAICDLDDIVPDTGVCALVNGDQVAVFRIGERELYAIDNVDPHAAASVLSRGLVGSLAGRVVVASPIYKQHFDLRTGECLEAPEHSVRAWAVRLEGNTVVLGRPER